MSENIHVHVGARLKQARTAKGWSLDKTNGHTGVSKAMLGQIERGESSPTVATLWKIASGFELPLSYFLEVESRDTVYATSDEPTAEIDIRTLFTFDPQTGMETFLITLSPGYEQESAPHNAGVIEHIVVVSGAMEYLLDGRWHPLATGEVAKFEANREHGYRNTGGQPAVFHNMICYRQ